MKARGVSSLVVTFLHGLASSSHPAVHFKGSMLSDGCPAGCRLVVACCVCCARALETERLYTERLHHCRLVSGVLPRESRMQKLGGGDADSAAEAHLVFPGVRQAAQPRRSNTGADRNEASQ